MSGNIFEEVINKLQNNNESLKALVAIRKKTEWPENWRNIIKLRRKGCLKHIVTTLQTSGKKPILDTCLCILANCIMVRKCARDLIQACNVWSHLNELLKRYPLEDTINRRIFRIIGNMCYHEEPWANLIIDTKPEIVIYIVEFIIRLSKDELPEVDYSEATIIMALRTLRLLLNGRTIKTMVTSLGVLKAASCLFIKLSAQFLADHSCENLLINIIHLLYDYSRYEYYPSIAELRTERGDLILHLDRTEMYLLSPKRIVKLISNFIQISQLEVGTDIPESTIVDMLIGQLISGEFEYDSEYFECICYLLDHSVNRDIERFRTCIPMLTEVLNWPNLKICILVINTLNGCQYGGDLIIDLMQEQLDCDIINILVKKLQCIVGSSDKFNSCHENVLKVVEISDSDDYDAYDYPPLYIEANNSGFSLTEDGKKIPIIGDQWLGRDNRVEEDLLRQYNTIKLEKLLIVNIARLLKSFCRLKPRVPQLGEEKLLICLLKCSQYSEAAFPSRVYIDGLIFDIVSDTTYLIPIMTTTFIQKIYDLTQVQHLDCSKCLSYRSLGKRILKHFRILAEADVGKGDITHILLRGTREMKVQLVLIIPYIVHDIQTLTELMINCGGLKILMQLLQESSIVKNHSIKVLCTMALDTFEIANPKNVDIDLRRKVIRDEYKFSNKCDNVVVFKLDDGTSVRADRYFLCKKSEFFNSLLNGQFKETKQNEVRLSNVESKSLRCLLQILTTVRQLETIDIEEDWDTILDIIVLCDRYLLPDICSSITNCVKKFHLSWKTAPIIYKWSIESGTNILRAELIAFALVAEITDDTRFIMFNELFNVGYPKLVIEDIETLLIRYMSDECI